MFTDGAFIVAAGAGAGAGAFIADFLGTETAPIWMGLFSETLGMRFGGGAGGTDCCMKLMRPDSGLLGGAGGGTAAEPRIC